MKKDRLLDIVGNYLCTIGMAGEQLVLSLLPIAVSLVALLLFRSFWGNINDFCVDKIAATKLSETLLPFVALAFQGAKYAWLCGAALMFWQRETGAVNALQNCTSGVYYLTIAFAMIGKIGGDVLHHTLPSGIMQVVAYAVGIVLFLVVLCLFGVLAVVFCVPQAVALALLIGVPLDLGIIYFKQQKIAQTQCWNETLKCLEDVDAAEEIFEVQLTDGGVFFVNGDNRVVECVNFANLDYPNLDFFARKAYIAFLMQQLPKGYYVESLKNMFVAENIALKTKLNRDETIRRRSQHKENKRRRSEGKSW